MSSSRICDMSTEVRLVWAWEELLEDSFYSNSLSVIVGRLSSEFLDDASVLDS